MTYSDGDQLFPYEFTTFPTPGTGLTLLLGGVFAHRREGRATFARCSQVCLFDQDEMKTTIGCTLGGST